jgi:tmRNA-binding protein
MAKHDITKTNLAIEQLLAVTKNPRHQFLLQAYHRHRYLEIAGRYEEIFAPEMMTANPAYHVHADETNAALIGQDQVKSLYRMWAETSQCIFYAENEEVAVADHFIASYTTVYQQVSGKTLKGNKLLSHLPHIVSDRLLKKALSAKNFTVDENDMYLYKTVVEMVWPYDDRGRLIGEDVWEPEPEKAELIKLAPSEVLTTAEAAKLLNPLIKPLPSFDEAVLGAKSPHAA